MNKLRGVFHSYDAILKKHPVVVQSAQTGILMAVGDISSQLVFEDKTLKSMDKLRTVKFASIGFFFIGPLVRSWYKILDHHVTGPSPKIVTFKKVALDQLVAAPVLLFVVTSGVSLLDDNSIEETKTKLQETYFTILITNYKVWPLIQAINFSLVPLHYQLLLVQIVAIFWNTYLSHKTHVRETRESSKKYEK